ncbi:hypothetical protein LCGC14_0795520 [marine sediment metagenome]|uniref:Uncharacterized protein n=1 Tax=marine sediment metagenome TaxID=412755 RepID=A0A0F9SYH3_9ZZZZ
MKRRKFFGTVLSGAVGAGASIVAPRVGADQHPATVVTAREEFGYGRLTHLQVGEVFALTGQKNDDLLLSTGLVKVVVVDTVLLRCTCGRMFTERQHFDNHLLRYGHREARR